jgi:putative tryptophan/tyrosine transport system substrate-binding protein
LFARIGHVQISFGCAHFPSLSRCEVLSSLCKTSPGGWMKRRDFMTLLGGTPAAWPLALRAQDTERVRRIGMLNALEPDDPEAQARILAFEQTLQHSGWVIGRNLKLEIRQIGGDVDRIRSYAAELVALAPDLIVSIGSVAVAQLQQATRTIPIVFVNAPDPVGAGFVQSMARPGGNITGFSSFEYSMSGKWAELLKQIAPNVTRALVLRDPNSAAGIGQFAAIRSVAQSLGIELTPVNVRESEEMEQSIAAFGASGIGGMIVTAGATGARRKLMISLAARYKLPAVYPYRYYAMDGGLVTYGPNTLDTIRRAGAYADRILKGEKPAEMPVQAPTKYELVLNLKTAKTLGLSFPQTVLATADEVIE